MGGFEGIYKNDEGWAQGGNRESMNNALGDSGASKGGPIKDNFDGFEDSNMNPAALGDPANSLPSVSNGSRPSSDGSFDCMCD